MMDDIASSALLERVGDFLEQYGDEAIAPLIKALCKEACDRTIVIANLIETVGVLTSVVKTQEEACHKAVMNCIDLEKRIVNLEQKHVVTVH